MPERLTPSRPAVVFNPTGGVEEAAVRDAIRAVTGDGPQDPLGWFLTTEDDPGLGQTRQALAGGADLILACGGDGTVAACATALTGTGVPLALLAAGTGNLLARNLHIPRDLGQAVDVAFGPSRRAIDVVRTDAERHFVIMAGLGLDAAMIKYTSARAKAALGWPAYVGGLARAVRRSPVATVRIAVDGAPEIAFRAVGVLLANVGHLQAGISMLADVSPSDGVLDVVVFAPRTWTDWPRIAGRVLRGRVDAGGRTETLRGARIVITSDRRLPLETDGDLAGEALGLTAEVLPRALTVCVPA